jgi:D-tyrosyl-tRNA(Tyr) deacylase
MKAIIQRVTNASVEIRGKIYSKIGKGLLVLLGVEEDDTEDKIGWLCQKIINMRIFSDDKDKMNLSVNEIKGELMIVSQFTLLADCSKGNRPSFIRAAKPEKAEKIYKLFIDESRKYGLSVKTGQFGAMMKVSLTNDGPVTIILEK